MDNHIAIDGADLVNSPQDHSKECLLLPQCIASGYFLLTKKEDGTYDYYYNFTQGQNALALEYIEASTKENDYYIRATGKYCSANDTVIVTSIEDASKDITTETQDGCVEQTWEGYLVDNFCWEMDNHIAIDGADLVNSPQDHSKECLLLPECVASGYFLLTKKEDGTYDVTYDYYYNFTQEQNALALEYIQASTKENDYYVRATGKNCAANGTVILSKIEDAGKVAVPPKGSNESVSPKGPEDGSEDGQANGDIPLGNGVALGTLFVLFVSFLL